MRRREEEAGIVLATHSSSEEENVTLVTFESKITMVDASNITEQNCIPLPGGVTAQVTAHCHPYQLGLLVALTLELKTDKRGEIVQHCVSKQQVFRF